jgi:hypothetical protein
MTVSMVTTKDFNPWKKAGIEKAERYNYGQRSN